MINTTYEKDGDGYLIGIDITNGPELIAMSKLVEKKEAKRLDRYIMGIAYYWSKQKLN